jgi:hypothetical protein
MLDFSVALALTGRRISRIHLVENNIEARVAAHQHIQRMLETHPRVVDRQCLRTLHEAPADIRDVNGQHLQAMTPLDLLVASIPCQDVSLAATHAEGLEGNRTGLFFWALEIWRSVKEYNPQADAVFECTDVELVSPADFQRITEELGMVPCRFDAADVSPSTRWRCFWTTYEVQPPTPQQGLLWQSILDADHQVPVASHDSVPPQAPWVRKGEPRSKAPTLPARMDSYAVRNGQRVLWNTSLHRHELPRVHELCKEMGVDPLAFVGFTYEQIWRLLGNGISIPQAQVVAAGLPRRAWETTQQVQELEQGRTSSAQRATTPQRQREEEGAQPQEGSTAHMTEEQDLDAQAADMQAEALLEELEEHLEDQVPAKKEDNKAPRPVGERPTPVTPSPAKLKQGVYKIMDQIRDAYQPGWEAPDANADTWWAELQQEMLNPDEFVAGSWGRHWEAWNALFDWMHERGVQKVKRTARQRDTLRWLKHGFKAVLRAPRAAAGEGEPRAQRKQAAAEKMLEEAMAPPQIQHYVEQDSPGEVHLRNRQSVYEGDNAAFTREQIEELKAMGTVRRWQDLPAQVTKGRDKPTIINPLSVATKTSLDSVKRRLCLDGRVENLFFKYFKVELESLDKLLDLITDDPGCWMCSSDLKSGYFHLMLHDSMWEYLAFEFDGEILCYVAAPFGLKFCTQVFSLILGEAYKPLRMLGHRGTSFIDDRTGVYSSRKEALAKEAMNLRLLTLLGCYFSRKAPPIPAQLCTYLGFESDSVAMKVQLPQDKITIFRRLVAELLAQETCSKRQLARVLGKLASFRPAVRVAKLYVTKIHQALKGTIAWDAVFETTAEARQVLAWFQDNVDRFNGTRLLKGPVGAHLNTDASDVGGGGRVWLTQGVSTEPRNWSTSFTEAQYLRTLATSKDHWSSTARELFVMMKAMQSVVQAHGPELQGMRVIYSGDNQAAIAGLNSMRSKKPDINNLIERIWELCLEHGIELEPRWVPRERLQAEDLLSKTPDSSQWALDKGWMQRKLTPLCNSAGHEWFTVDAFADPSNNASEQFISEHWTPGCIGVDAFTCGPLLGGKDAKTGRQHLALMNGPFSRVADIILLIRRYRIDCVLVTPNWPRHWTAMLARLPIRLGPVPVDNAPGICKPGPRNPHFGQQVQTPQWSMSVYLVIWDRA